jgi:hypothetical protein
MVFADGVRSAEFERLLPASLCDCQRRDPMTGETLLRVRIPDTELLNRALEILAGLVESLRRSR